MQLKSSPRKKSMKFLLDENLPISLKFLFKKKGFSVVSVREEYKGMKDEEIWEIAQRNKMVIITRDLDFPLYPSSRFPLGLILLRVPSFYTAKQIVNLMEEFLEKITASDIEGNIIVVSPGQIRLRKISSINKT